MKNLIKPFIATIACIITVIAILGLLSFIAGPSQSSINFKKKYTDKTLSKVVEAEDYCKENNFNEDFCILIDMSIHSGKNRFRVYNFKQNKFIESFPVSHGCGNNSWGSGETGENPNFSNTVDSHLSSLGKYAIGDRGWSSWGVNVNYKLHGLDYTNSNAYDRYIVFHSWEWISDNEIYPARSAEGWGCPAVSNNNFMKLDKLLKNQTKPTLMWIYNE